MNKRHLFYSILVILLLIVTVTGWFATDYLGNNARQEIIGESRASALTLSIHVSDTLKSIEGAVKSLAGSPWIAPVLLSRGYQDIENANSALDRYKSALNASVSYLMDADGMTVASSNRKDPDSFVGKSYGFRPYFQVAAKGQPGRYFGLGMTSQKRGFYASYPVRDRLGKVLGVVVMKKDLDEMETFFSQYPFCFLISPEGIIFLSSSPAMVLKTLWPLDKKAEEKLISSKQFGNKLSGSVLLKKEIADGTEVTLEGKDYFVSRKVIDSDGWSIVVLTPTDRIRNYSLISILLTVVACSLIIFFSVIIYLTERSRIAIRQSEELYKALAEKSIAGVYVTQDGKFRFINANAASYAGYAREELLGQEAGLLVNPEDREKVKQNTRAMLRGEINSPYEFRIITKQGEIRWIMESVTSILHEGRPAILGNSMNITERKRVEEALKESEERYKSIVGSVKLGITLIDKNHKIIMTNKYFAELFNKAEAYFVGKYCFMESEKREAICPHCPGTLSMASRKPAEVETEGILDDGSRFNALIRTVPTFASDGTVSGFIEVVEDITERKRVEEALKENRSRLADVIAFLPDATLAIDKEKRIIIWNKAMEEMTGIPATEMIGKGDYAYSIPFYGEARPQLMDLVFLDREEIAARYPKITREGDSITAEAFCNALYNNKGAWTFAKASPLHDQYGNIIGAIEIVRDITESKRLSEALIKREVQLNEVGIIAKVGGWEFDVGSLKQVWTKEVYRIHEVDESYEPTVRDGIEFYTPESRPVMERAVQRAIEHGEPFDVELEIITAKGNHRWVHANGNAYQENGKTKKISGTFQDITERRQAVDALRESEVRYRTLVDNATEIIFRTDDTGRFSFVNPAAIRITGYEEKELIGKHYPTLIHPDRRDETIKFFSRQFVKGIQNTYLEYPILTKEGHEVWLGQSTLLIAVDGHIVGFQAVARDIMDRRRMEAEIIALSITDQLTGLHNRRGFLSLAEQQLKLAERNKRGMLLFFADLDGLKWINDTLGHEEGDKLLIEAATVLKEIFRTSDIIARLGGDEYAVLAVGINEADSGILTARLQSLIDTQNNQENRRYRLSISVGCSYYDPGNPCSIDELMASADKLMYEQKQNKKGLLLQRGGPSEQ